MWVVCVAAYPERAVLDPGLRAHLGGVQAPAVADLCGEPSEGRAVDERCEMVICFCE